MFSRNHACRRSAADNRRRAESVMRRVKKLHIAAGLPAVNCVPVMRRGYATQSIIGCVARGFDSLAPRTSIITILACIGRNSWYSEGKGILIRWVISVIGFPLFWRAWMTIKATNIIWHAGKVAPDERTAATGNRPCIVWLTGLSGCGKSTIAMSLEHQLVASGHPAYVLDGDNLRHGLNRDLGFSPEDRAENIRRAGEVARLLADAGVIAISSFISPYAADRDAIRAMAGPGQFVEVFVDAPLNICERRDPKGLYKKARAAIAEGRSLMLTGVDAPYEAPRHPEIHLHTESQSVEECVKNILDYLRRESRLVE